MTVKKKTGDDELSAAENLTADAPAAELSAGETSDTTGGVAFPYATTGAAFTAWFNERVRRLPNPVVRLGAGTATVRELHPDGRLEVSLHASAGVPEQQFIPFESAHLDELLLKFAAQGN